MSKALLWIISSWTGFRGAMRCRDVAPGDMPDDPRALSTSAFSSSMPKQDSSKSLASQLTSMVVFLRESKAFQRMEKSLAWHLVLLVTAQIRSASLSVSARLRGDGQGDLRHCFDLLCPA